MYQIAFKSEFLADSDQDPAFFLIPSYDQGRHKNKIFVKFQGAELLQISFKLRFFTE
jgi:hypothetical protein